MTSSHKHTSYTEGCFTCKVKTLRFGVVPGGYKDLNSTTMWEKDETISALPTTEEVRDRQSDFHKRWPDLGD